MGMKEAGMGVGVAARRGDRMVMLRHNARRQVVVVWGPFILLSSS